MDSNDEDEFDDHDLEPITMQGIFQNEATTAAAKRVTSANPDSIKSRDLRNDAFMKRMSIESGSLEEAENAKPFSALAVMPEMYSKGGTSTSVKKSVSRLQSAKPTEIRLNKARKPPIRPKQS